MDKERMQKLAGIIPEIKVKANNSRLTDKEFIQLSDEEQDILSNILNDQISSSSSLYDNMTIRELWNNIITKGQSELYSEVIEIDNYTEDTILTSIFEKLGDKYFTKCFDDGWDGEAWLMIEANPQSNQILGYPNPIVSDANDANPNTYGLGPGEGYFPFSLNKDSGIISLTPEGKKYGNLKLL